MTLSSFVNKTRSLSTIIAVERARFFGTLDVIYFQPPRTGSLSLAARKRSETGNERKHGRRAGESPNSVSWSVPAPANRILVNPLYLRRRPRSIGRRGDLFSCAPLVSPLIVCYLRLLFKKNRERARVVRSSVCSFIRTLVRSFVRSFRERARTRGRKRVAGG